MEGVYDQLGGLAPLRRVTALGACSTKVLMGALKISGASKEWDE